MELSAKSPGLQRAGTSGFPAPARRAVEDLLGRLDHALPDRVQGFYLVGSVALGAFREGRSDVDFLAIVEGSLDRGELARLRAIHLGCWSIALVRDAVVGHRWPLVCNGSYLTPEALARSPLEVEALAGHVAGRFAVGARGGFDVNPVTWHVLARHGVAVRGPEPGHLDIRAEAAELRAWTLGNLDGYWRAWAERARRPGRALQRASPRRFAASGVLGVARLHYTLATGEIASKETAGEYALGVFEPAWRPAIEDALAFWRGDPPVLAPRGRSRRRIRLAAEFVSHVIASHP